MAHGVLVKQEVFFFFTLNVSSISVDSFSYILLYNFISKLLVFLSFLFLCNCLKDLTVSNKVILYYLTAEIRTPTKKMS